MRSMAMVGRAKWEYEVQAEVEYTFRRRNADFWGYPSIVGCGANATTLHYVESQSEIRKGDLLLMDVGAEYEHYTADVTRTFPVNGKFTKEQAEIYQIVYDAQEAVATATKPGVKFQDLQQIARATIADGLLKLGLITKKEQVGYWFIHGLGHWLGMNVHDVGRYGVPLQAGMVFTNEPGIYIREDALDNMPDTPENKAFKDAVRPAFEKYKNIGVRIEDDMLVTATGVEWMTKALPRKIEDIEKFMAQASKEMSGWSGRIERPLMLDSFGYIQHPAISGTTARKGFVWSGNRAAAAGDGHRHGSHAD
jgi:Xaa-Pro aminopeptidase